jgi:hypothetical protein
MTFIYVIAAVAAQATLSASDSKALLREAFVYCSRSKPLAIFGAQNAS